MLDLLPFNAFDVNETRLDLDAKVSVFERLFKDKAAMRRWLANLIEYSAARPAVAGRVGATISS